MTKYPYSRDMRLRRQADFDRIHQGNVYAADSVLVMLACRNNLQMTRMGISLSRKVGNAVVRNRWKRLIREAFRLQREELPVGLDLVVRPRRGAIASCDAIRRSLRQLAARIERNMRRDKQCDS